MIYEKKILKLPKKTRLFQESIQPYVTNIVKNQILTLQLFWPNQYILSPCMYRPTHQQRKQSYAPD